jgi:DNA-binding CsgD family transcriptional regulator
VVQDNPPNEVDYTTEQKLPAITVKSGSELTDEAPVRLVAVNEAIWGKPPADPLTDQQAETYREIHRSLKEGYSFNGSPDEVGWFMHEADKYKQGQPLRELPKDPFTMSPKELREKLFKPTPPSKGIGSDYVVDPHVKLEPVPPEQHSELESAPIRIPGIRPRIHNTNQMENVSLQPARSLTDTDLNWLEANTKWEGGVPVSTPKLEEHQAPDEDKLTLKKFLFGHHPYETWVERMPKEFVKQTLNAVKGMHGIMSGQIDAASPEATKSVFDFATLMVGGVPGVKTEGSLGSFAGVGSKTADLEKLDVAKLLTKAGATPKAIAAETGWMKDVKDNFWKYRVNDSQAKLKEEAFNISGAGKNLWYNIDLKGKKLGEVYDHPEIYQAYPELAQAEVKPIIFSFGTKGSFEHNADVIRLAGSESLEDIKSTLAHEIQHYIQSKEGFGYGGSPAMFTPQNLKLLDDVIRRSENELTTKVNQALKSYPLTEPTGSLKAGRDWIPTARGFSREIERFEIEGPRSFSSIDKKLQYIKANSPETYEALKVFDQAEQLAKKTRDTAFEHYQRVAGEIEARQVQRELNQSPEELKGILPDTGFNGKEAILKRAEGPANEERYINRPPGKLNAEGVQKIKDLVAEGKSVKEIAKELNVIPNSVYVKIREQGIRAPGLESIKIPPANEGTFTERLSSKISTELPSKNNLSAADYPHMQRQFLAALDKGITTREGIAGELQVSPYIVSRLADRFGLDFKLPVGKTPKPLGNNTNQSTPRNWTPERDRELLKHINDGLSYSEVGALLGLTRNQVAGRYNRIK